MGGLLLPCGVSTVIEVSAYPLKNVSAADLIADHICDLPAKTFRDENGARYVSACDVSYLLRCSLEEPIVLAEEFQKAFKDSAGCVICRIGPELLDVFLSDAFVVPFMRGVFAGYSNFNKAQTEADLRHLLILFKDCSRHIEEYLRSR